MAEYNKLTKRLLEEGYTVENYPSYVTIDTSMLSGGDPLNNLGGGFVYKKDVRDAFVYKTGCGLYVMGNHAFEVGMCIEWRHEDDNPITHCPFRNEDCKFNDERLRQKEGTERCFTCYCVCHRTDEAYDYENSVERHRKLKEEEKEKKYQEYADAHGGRVCRNHMHYNDSIDDWELCYSPDRCASVCYSQNGFCPILNRQLNKKKGNVYYDVKQSWTVSDGPMLPERKIVSIIKGNRYFKKRVSLDICDAFIRLESEEIYRKYYWNHVSHERLIDKSFQVEILNIRAESRVSRNLQQDLEDIKNGIEVVHVSDMERTAKENKKKRREEARKRQLKRIEKKIMATGLDSLSYSEQKKVDKYLSDERVSELVSIYQENLKIEEPVQLELFKDMGLERVGKEGDANARQNPDMDMEKKEELAG